MAQELTAKRSSWVEETLEALARRQLLREFLSHEGEQGPELTVGGRRVIVACSNNYLDLARHQAMKQTAAAAAQTLGCGGGASRYVSGNLTLYDKLERATAQFKQYEAALVFPTGYQANVGAIPALCGQDDIIFSDQLNHASLIDGIRLSRARVVIYPHADVEALKRLVERNRPPRNGWIISDGVFSMDGDLCPLPAMLDLARFYHLHTYVDDAHGTGVLGDEGRGIVEHFGLKQGPDVLMGTFSKAMGSLGGFVCTTAALAALIRNRCRSLIYSTALPPSVLAANLQAIPLVQEAAAARRRLRQLRALLARRLSVGGLHVADSPAPILPVIIGESARALRVARALLRQGVLAPAIRPPTVPEGTARIRLSLMAGHHQAHVTHIAEALTRAIKET